MTKAFRVIVVCLLVLCLAAMIPLAASAESISYWTQSTGRNFRLSAEHTYFYFYNGSNRGCNPATPDYVVNAATEFNRIGTYFDWDLSNEYANYDVKLIAAGSTISMNVYFTFLSRLKQNIPNYDLSQSLRIYGLRYKTLPGRVSKTSYQTTGEIVILDYKITSLSDTKFSVEATSPAPIYSLCFDFTVPSGTTFYSLGLGNPVYLDEVSVSSVDMTVITVDPSAQKEQEAIDKANSALDSAKKDQEALEDFQNEFANTDNVQLNQDYGNWENFIEPSKFSTMKTWIQKCWDALGGPINFVLGFSLLIGLAIFILGKKSKQ